MSTRSKTEEQKIDLSALRKTSGSKVNLSQAAGSGLALYGRVSAVGLFLGAVAMLALGIWFTVHHNKWTHQAKAQILTATCGPVDDNGNRSCKLSITYTVKGVTYPQPGKPAIFVETNGSEAWAVGETVTICYNPNNPSDVVIKSPDTKWLGIVLIVVGALFVLAMGGVLYAVFKNKQAAASFGAFEVITNAVGSVLGM